MAWDADREEIFEQLQDIGRTYLAGENWRNEPGEVLTGRLAIVLHQRVTSLETKIAHLERMVGALETRAIG